MFRDDDGFLEDATDAEGRGRPGPPIHRILILLFFLALPNAQAAGPCVACHPKEVAGYRETGMGRSMSRSVSQPPGRFRRAISKTELTLRSRPQGMIHRLEQDGLVAEYATDYVIGSGNATFGYLIKIGDRLFQSPAAYYTKRGVWDVAPGYEQYRLLDFTRPITGECLWCHAGLPRLVENTLNQYEEAVFAEQSISCDRCHGPVEAHLASPSAGNIVNPAKLPATLRDAVCEQCHLSGEARVLNPGRGFGDFQAGMPLESVFSVYTYDLKGARSKPDQFKVVSHVDQLALSRCADKSGEAMWCGTCHNPHEKPKEPAAYYRQRCLSCHQPLPAKHPEPAADCVACHMARRQARDSGHSAFTDHRISRRPARDPKAAEEPSRRPSRQRLRAWREPPAQWTQRNLGIAYVKVGEKEHSVFHFREGRRRLLAVKDTFARDAAVVSALGLATMHLAGEGGADSPKAALAFFQQAVALEPDQVLNYPQLAAAWWELGEASEAIAQLERAIELDPYFETAYHMLAHIYGQTQRPELARRTWRQYQRFRPQSIAAGLALRRLGSGESDSAP